MRMVRHPNVVHLHEVFARKTKIYMVIDFMEGGELYKEMPQNILLDSQGNLKVADFGLSALVDPQYQGQDNLLKTMCGTPVYSAPEVHKGHAYDGAKADVWSCGVILYEMITGKLPFRERANILKAEYKFPQWFPNGPKSLIKKILHIDPAQRITISDILLHRWFKKGYPHPASMPEIITINDTTDIDYVFDGSEESSNLVIEKRKKYPFIPPQVDAFQLIAGYSADNLFGRFFLDRVGRAKMDKRFVFKSLTGDIIDKIKAAATKAGLVMKKKKSKEKEQNEFMLMLEADAPGKKGLVSIKTDVYKLGATSHYLLLLSKSDGDSLEYQQCCTELAKGLEGIIWGNNKEEHTDD